MQALIESMLNQSLSYERKDENQVNFVGFSRNRERYRDLSLYRERGIFPNLGGTTDLTGSP